MKTHTYYFKAFRISMLLSICSIGFTACNDFLEIKIQDSVTAETYYNTVDQMEKALVAAYAPLGNTGMYKQSLGVVLDLASDDAYTAEGRWQGYMNFNIANDNADLFDRGFKVAEGTEIIGGQGIYNSIYEGIMRSNLVLHHLPMSEAKDELRIEGEARFLRALYYHHIVHLWAEAAWVTDANFQENAHDFVPTTDIANQIAEDLQTIVDEDLLPWAGTDDQLSGRASMDAALALLARHWLYHQEPDKAKPLLEAVIANGYHQLIPVEDIWTVAGDNSTENLFEVQFSDEVGGHNPYFDDNKSAAEITMRNAYVGPKQTGAWQNIFPIANLVDEYETGDLRKTHFILSNGDTIPFEDGLSYKATNAFPYGILKGIKSGASAQATLGSGEFTENFPIIRYADVLLMYAETLIASNPSQAQDLIDQVRARAFGYATTADLRADNLGVSNYMAAEGLSLLEALKHERRMEFCFEGLRYFDLVRWGDCASNAILQEKGWSEAKTRYYPIPLEDLNYNDSFGN